MVNNYEKIFQQDLELLLAGTKKINKKSIIEKNKTLKMVYAGNLGLGRWNVLVELAKKIQKLNNEKKVYSLDIYSSNRPSERIVKKLERYTNVIYKGSVSAEELTSILNKADILVHVESFEKKNRKRTKMSISTKIPNYLGLGKVLLAIGPEEVASIKHISSNKAGICVTEYKQLENKLKTILSNENNINDLSVENALNLAEREHKAENISLKVQNALNNVYCTK